MTTLIASMTMVSCNDDKVEVKSEGGDTPVTEKTVAENAADVAPSKVSGSIAPVAQIFNGEKYAPTKLAHNNDYFIVYFTASW